MNIFKDHKKDPRLNITKLRIADSIDGVWIEKGEWDYDCADGAIPYEERWDFSWCPLDFHGRDTGCKHVYKSVEEAKKRLTDTDNFNNVKKTTYIDV